MEKGKELSVWWALQAVFWFWKDYGLPLIPLPPYLSTAWWHGFHLRQCLKDDDLMTLEDIGTPREAVSIDVSYWEE